MVISSCYIWPSTLLNLDQLLTCELKLQFEPAKKDQRQLSVRIPLLLLCTGANCPDSLKKNKKVDGL